MRVAGWVACLIVPVPVFSSNLQEKTGAGTQSGTGTNDTAILYPQKSLTTSTNSETTLKYPNTTLLLP